MSSLFERFGLDPLATPEQITERLRELVEDAPEAERAALRAAWEELTLHPRRRIAAAVGSFVDLAPPPAPPRPARPTHAPGPPPRPEPIDVVALAPLEDLLDDGPGDSLPLPDLSEDPLLTEPLA